MIPYTTKPDFELNVDYASHPLFSKFQNASPNDSSKMTELIKKVDSKIEKHWKVSPQAAQSLHAEVTADLAALEAEILQTVEPGSEAYELLKKTFKRTWDSILAEVDYRNRPPTKSVHLSEKNQGAVQKYETDGFVAWEFPKSDIEQLNKLAQPYEKTLRDKKEKAPKVLCNMALPLNCELSKYVEFILKRDEVFSLVEAIQGGRKMQLNYVSISFAHPDEEWWSCYSQDGRLAEKTAYMHYDEDPENQKMLIYLSEVQPENGPFHFVKGSHRWKRSPFLFAWGRMLDREIMNYSYPERSKSPLGAYIRPFAYPKYRQLFMQLPPILRRLGQFGDDILSDSDLSEKLRKNEVQVTSKIGNAFVFAGDQGIHRGGLVEKGERWSLQLGFKEAAPKDLVKEGKHVIAQSIKKVFGESAFDRIREVIRGK